MRMLIRQKKRQKYLYIISLAVLIVGICSAVNIYLSVPNPSDNMLELEPEVTKTYLRNLEMYGGKANVLAYEIRSWYARLWEGESLAYTMGCITIAVSYALFWIGYMSGSGYKEFCADKTGGDNRDLINKNFHDDSV